MRARWLVATILLALAAAGHLLAVRWDLRQGEILGFLSPRAGWDRLPAAVVGLIGPVVAVLLAVGWPARGGERWRRRLSLVLVAGVLPVVLLGTAAAATGIAPRAVWPFGAVWIFVILLVALFAALPRSS
ncbi:MAG: hypothetical protein ACYTJ0_16155 [Planctomycetota bacterium]|jgi:hypothetical protein